MFSCRSTLLRRKALPRRVPVVPEGRRQRTKAAFFCAARCRVEPNVTRGQTALRSRTTRSFLKSLRATGARSVSQSCQRLSLDVAMRPGPVSSPSRMSATRGTARGVSSRPDNRRSRNAAARLVNRFQDAVRLDGPPTDAGGDPKATPLCGRRDSRSRRHLPRQWRSRERVSGRSDSE